MPQYHLVDLAKPEIAAYALAKYSRSNLSIKEAIALITDEKAATFHEKFAIDNDYGHASIRDMAYAGLGVENVSMWAATIIEDEPLWSGQEKSTRYQDFAQSGYYTPPEAADGQMNVLYRHCLDDLFRTYAAMTGELIEKLTAHVPRPEHISKGKAKATIQARVLDIMRSLLPFATLTSVGQINAARSLGPQLSRLMGSSYAELRDIGAGMYEAYKPVLPTLLKHVEPLGQEQRYRTVVREAVLGAIEPYMDVFVYPCHPVDAVDLSSDPVTEAVTNMIYQFLAGVSYRQAGYFTRSIGPETALSLYELALQERGPYDRWPRTHFTGGGGVAYDILCDAKSMQDFFRHRRCIQIRQDLMQSDSRQNFPQYTKFQQVLEPEAAFEWFNHGLPFGGDSEKMLSELNLLNMVSEFDRVLGQAAGAGAAFALDGKYEAAQYALPMGFKRRCLFKMDDEQTAYIIKTRTGAGGHFAYRKAADQLFTAFSEVNPLAARYTDVTRYAPLNPETFWQR
jgi:thymidylate synthase ThyX